MSADDRPRNTTPLLITGADLAGAGAGDILVVDGTITAIGADATEQAPRDAQRYHGEGLVALPGLVDLHTHLREPGREDAETIETGARAHRSTSTLPAVET